MIELSKFISLILRHKPEVINLKVDENGWVYVQELINGIKSKGYTINFEILEEIVKNNNKQRFTFNDDKTKIRANQGHSINVDLNFIELTPPNILYHGTSTRFLNSIFKEGITKQSRNYVHLSDNFQTAIEVGKRHGNPIVLEINSIKMFEDGFKFYKSKNGVWLTEIISPMYIINKNYI